MRNDGGMGVIYTISLTLRLYLCLFSFSFIHPDEFWQNPQVVAHHFFTYGVNKPEITWEWSPDNPVRSITPVYLTTGLAFTVLSWFTSNPSAIAIFRAERLIYFVLSLFHDVVFFRLSTSSTQKRLYLTSPLPYTFLLRPFSNTLEALLLSLSLFLLKLAAFPCSRTRRRNVMYIGGFLLALGTWTRITFLAYFIPIIVHYVFYLSPSWSPHRFISLISPALISLAVFTSLFVAIDTFYFEQTTPVFTPFNLFKYNSSADNLANHGIHPRWLHVVVNGHIVFGIMWSIVLHAIVFQNDLSFDKVYGMSIVIPTAVLSYFPHQEPRFLLPLFVPCVLWAGEKVAMFRGRIKAMVTHILHSLIIITLFGILHQGGLLPTLFHLNNFLRTDSAPSNVHLVFWKTFMPPTHLLFPTLPTSNSSPFITSSIHVTDLGSTDLSILRTALCSQSYPSFLIVPGYALPRDWRSSLKLNAQQVNLGSGGLHLDMDRLDKMWEQGWEQTGIQIFNISCIS